MAKKRILIVEDEKIVALDLKRILLKLGYEVIGSVNSGKEAINSAQRLKPDSILMDITLVDDIDGIEAASQIRKFSNIPIIFLTGNSDPVTLESAKLTEPFAYLFKPFNERQIKITMELAISKNLLEKKLIENVQWLNTTLKSVGDGIIATDFTGKIKFINTVAEKITGWKQEEAVEKDLNDVFVLKNQYTREKIENPVFKVFRERRIIGIENDNILISKNGSEINIDNSAYPIYDTEGKISGAVLTFHDISEIYRAQKNLQIKEEINRSIIESSLDALVMIDEQGYIFEWNKQAEKIFGWSENEIIGNEIFDVIIHEKYRESFKVSIKKFLETGSGPFFNRRIEILAVNRKGTELDIELTVTPIKTGDYYIFSSFIRDITEKKQIEKFILAEMHVLEMATQNISLTDLLEFLIKNIEEINKDTFGSILFLESDKVTVKCGPAPSLPKEYSDSLNGVRIGPNSGSCGTAMYKKLPVIVSDIENDILWRDYKELALKFGLKACWSFPILTIDNEVLGSFAFYYKKINSPSDKDIEFIARAAYIASLLITKNKADEALRNSESMLSLIYYSTSDLMCLTSVEGINNYQIISFNKSFQETTKALFGNFSEPELLGKRFDFILENIFKLQKSVVNKNLEKSREAIETGQIIKYDDVADTPKLKYYSETTITPIFDENGKCTHLLYVSRNINRFIPPT